MNRKFNHLPITFDPFNARVDFFRKKTPWPQTFSLQLDRLVSRKSENTRDDSFLPEVVRECLYLK